MLSIVIPTLNEQRYLPLLLKDLSKQSFTDFEIIVSDSGSEDRTREQALRWKGKFRSFRFIRHGKRNVADARNQGAKAARGEWLGFIDADARLKEDFLERAVPLLAERRTDCAAAYIWPLSRHPGCWAYYALLNSVFFLFQHWHPHAAGTTLFCKRDLFTRLRGFDRSVTFAEDADFVRRAGKRGKFRVIPLSVRTSVRRFKKEGMIPLGWKYLLAFFHRVFLGEIRNEKFKYPFGHYGKP